MNYAGQNIAVLGLGRSGKAAARLLARERAQVTLLDSGASHFLQKESESLAAEFRVMIGPAAEQASGVFDQIVLSPGIDPAARIVRQFSERGIPVTGELELASQLNQTPVAAITGTNGKTTTTELVAQMLAQAEVATVACGNIGLPFSEVVLNGAALDLITLEVSSFQLETISSFHPHLALWLNLTADHLDRYASFEEYRAAKLRIFENQTEDDFAIVNSTADLPVLRARRICFSATSADADFTLQNGAITFRGERLSPLSAFRLGGLHNVENIMAALGVAFALQIPFARVLPALQSYTPAPHRCEQVATIEGVAYINDSKATNPDALARALESLSQPVVLIAGGKDKGFRFDSLNNLIARKVKKAFLIGEMAEEMRAEWQHSTDCFPTASLAAAVQAAHDAAEAGDVVLFSPGTSSFDMFRDYADRGNQFRFFTQNLANRASAPILT